MKHRRRRQVHLLFQASAVFGVVIGGLSWIDVATGKNQWGDNLLIAFVAAAVFAGTQGLFGPKR